MLQTRITSSLLESARLANEINDSLRLPAILQGLAAKRRLQSLGRLAARLPLNRDDYCYFVNRAASTIQLIEDGEMDAAAYQLREQNGKLVHLLAGK